MFSLLSEFTRNIGRTLTIIVMDEDGLDKPRPYSVQPGRFMSILAGSFLGLFLLTLSLLLFTPVRGILPGYGTIEMRREARLNQLRLAAMTDSLSIQEAYIGQLRDLMLGTIDTTLASRAVPDLTSEFPGEPVTIPQEPASENWTDHEQPALPISRLTSIDESGADPPVAPTRYLSGLKFPVMPPVTGLLSRGFDARTGHYAVDIAVGEGSAVRAIGDGYVILADDTRDGGQIIVVQHADGFASIYKHNDRLLKRVGDRVRDREVIATSGNTGEITTGPHVHFELWHNGLAQDPNYYFIGM